MGGHNPGLLVWNTEGVVVSDLTVARGLGTTVAVVNGDLRLERLLVRDSEESGVNLGGPNGASHRVELVDVEVRGQTTDRYCGACLVTADVEAIAHGLRLSDCTGAGIRMDGGARFSGEDVFVSGVRPSVSGRSGIGVLVQGRTGFGARNLRILDVGTAGLMANMSVSSDELECPEICRGHEVDGVCPSFCLLDSEIGDVGRGSAEGGGIGLVLQRMVARVGNVHIHDTAGPGIWATKASGRVEDTRIERAHLGGVVLGVRGRGGRPLVFSGLDVRQVGPNADHGGGVGVLALFDGTEVPLQIEDASLSDFFFSGIYAKGAPLQLDGVAIRDTAGPGIFAFAASRPLDVAISGLELDAIGTDGLLLEGPLVGDVDAGDLGAIGGEPLYRQRCEDAGPAVSEGLDPACRPLWRETRPYLSYAFSLRESDIEP